MKHLQAIIKSIGDPIEVARNFTLFPRLPNGNVSTT